MDLRIIGWLAGLGIAFLLYFLFNVNREAHKKNNRSRE